ncbi:FecR family protein [Chitinophaga sp. MM2321]|uniref:FecR family protein n=1 Tax=Chitinophaga sp. MM2321 TaxID=3137178 RepID=UPI0032D595A2
MQLLDDPGQLKIWNELIGELYQKNAGDEAGFQAEEVVKLIHFILHHSHQDNENAVAPDDLLAAAGEIPADSHTAVAPPATRRIHLLKTTWFRYAAAVLMLVFAGGYLYYNHTPKQEIASIIHPVQLPNDVLPGSEKAMLTLSSGKKIALDSSTSETINDGDLGINNKNGTLTYGKSAVVSYNTLSTPKGGQYKLTLPDGTNVLLNAASSITYPTSFQGNARAVSITGEAYFEVTRDPSKPFTVKTYKDEIVVLGTSFNVNSYTDEPDVKTSLLEGSVHVNNIVLKPGEACRSGKITTTDLDQDLAWKNGVFNFHHVKLTDAMRQLSRWYDVDVRYEGKHTDVEFGGEISRKLTLNQVLSGLQDKDVHFNLKGRTLTVIQ